MSKQIKRKLKKGMCFRTNAPCRYTNKAPDGTMHCDFCGISEHYKKTLIKNK